MYPSFLHLLYLSQVSHLAITRGCKRAQGRCPCLPLTSGDALCEGSLASLSLELLSLSESDPELLSDPLWLLESSLELSAPSLLWCEGSELLKEIKHISDQNDFFLFLNNDNRKTFKSANHLYEIKGCLPSWCTPWHCLITILKLNKKGNL